MASSPRGAPPPPPADDAPAKPAVGHDPGEGRRPAPAAPRPSDVARNIISSTFAALFDGTATWAATTAPPQDTQTELDVVIAATKQLSYRDALVVQFAFWLAGETDTTNRAEGARSVAGWLGNFLTVHHIRAVKDAFQNIGKNTANLARGNFGEFDQLLRWAAMADRTREDVEAAFRYLCVKVAATARAVVPMPPLNVGELTFGVVGQLFTRLFAIPSGGAYQQFGTASLLHALVEQQGVTSARVDTKNLNASDRSSRAAGDIQILLGNRVVEAFEVTANDWHEKLAGAAATIRENDLSRLTIIAGGVEAAGTALFAELSAQAQDLSVLDVSSFATSLISALTRQGRAAALRRLYEFLDRYQPRVEITNQYVALLRELRLAEEPAPAAPTT